MTNQFNLKSLKVVLACVIMMIFYTDHINAEIYREIRLFAETNVCEQHEFISEILPFTTSKLYHDLIVNDYEFNSIEAKNCKNEILNNDMVQFYEKRLTNYKTNIELLSGEYFRLGSLNGYFRCDEIYAELDRMIEKYPDFIRKNIIDYSYENNPIYEYCISSDLCSNSKSKGAVLITSLHHGNEQGSAFAVIYYLWDLFKRFDNADAEAIYVLNSKMIYVIPVVNPDGVIYNDTTAPNGGGMWRKNRRINQDGSIGVDLNRNYGPGYAWNAPNNGSSIRGNLETYRGDSAFSEPESRCIRDFVAGKNIKLAVNVHTYGNCVVYPYSYLTEVNPDSLWYRSFLSEKFRNSGYLFGLDVDVIRFPYRGTSEDFMYIGGQTFRSIKSMALEIGTYSDGFWAPINSIIEESKKNIRFFNDVILSSGANIALIDHDVIVENGRYYIRLTLQNVGTESLDLFRFSLISNQEDLIVEKKIFLGSSLSINESKEFFVEYFPSGIANGEIAKFSLNLDLGYTKKIDFELPVYEYEEQDILSKEFSEQWQLNDSWNIIQNYDDEPYLVSNISDYYEGKQNSFAFFKIDNTADSIARYTLRFDHWYNIETNFDFGLIWTKDDSGRYRNMKDGEYMTKGSNRLGGVQDDTLWGFHGVFNFWFPQLVYLGNMGDKINELAFNLRTDAGLNKKGWKIKNLKLRKFKKIANPNYVQLDTRSYIQLFPNPAKDFIDISFDEANINNNSNVNIFIYNSAGNIIDRICLDKYPKTYQLDISNYMSGTYFIKNGDKIYKFIKIE